MTEPRRTLRVSPQTQAYNPSAIAAAQRQREIELGAKPRRTGGGGDWRAAKRARLEAFRKSMSEIKSIIAVGDELCDEERGGMWRVESIGDVGEEMDKIRLSWITSGIPRGCQSFDVPEFDAMLCGHPIPQSHGLAFAMASHVRLGKTSVFAGLVPDLVQRIVQAAGSTARFSKVECAGALPIPVKLVLGGDSPMEVQLDTLKAPMKRAIENTLVGWKWKSTFENGFGTVTPSRISWTEICSLAVPQITDGYRPGGGRVEGYPLLEIHETCTLVDKSERIMKAYTRACQRGAQQFEIAYENVWRCGHHNPCIGGENRVLLAGGAHKLVRDLCVGDTVSLGTEGTAQVTATWCSRVGRSIPLVSVQGVLLTPDHPVCSNGTWLLPSSLSPPQPLFVDAVFNFALSSGHSLMLLPAATAGGGEESVDSDTGAYVQCCTLGKPVPGMPDALWGSEMIFEAIRAVPGFPRMVTIY